MYSNIRTTAKELIIRRVLLLIIILVGRLAAACGVLACRNWPRAAAGLPPPRVGWLAAAPYVYIYIT